MCNRLVLDYTPPRAADRPLPDLLQVFAVPPRHVGGKKDSMRPSLGWSGRHGH